MKHTISRKTNLAFSILLIVALVFTTLFTFWASTTPESSYAATTGSGKATAPTPYAWSKTAAPTTGNLFADNYVGVNANNVFEAVTVDRLADILSAAGDYYVAFANPRSDVGQKVLQNINAEAKKAGISKIYVFNPVVDNQRLDIVSNDPAITGIVAGSWTTDITGGAAGTSFASIPHSIGGIYTYIQSFLPVYYAANTTESDLATRAIFDKYKSNQTLLFRFHKDKHTDRPASAKVPATYVLTPDDLSSYDASVQAKEISKVFKDGEQIVKADTRSEYEFIKRAFTAAGANPAISDTDFASGATYTGDTITVEELFNILNSPGEHSFYFYAFGCSDTKPLIAKALKAARDNNTKLYLVDGSLGGSIRFKTGASIDSTSSTTSNAWLNIRQTAIGNGSTNINYLNLSYIYGEMANYFGTGFITQNEFKKDNFIRYYQNGDIGNPDALTTGYRENGAVRPDAPRLQYPILITYNKAYSQPVTLDTTAIQVTKNAAGIVTKVTEYMNSAAAADTDNFGGSATKFPNVYIPYAEVTDPVFLENARFEQKLNESLPYVDRLDPHDGSVAVDEKNSATLFDGITSKIKVVIDKEYEDIFEDFAGSYAKLKISNSLDAAAAFRTVLIKGEDFDAFDISLNDNLDRALKVKSGEKVTIIIPIPAKLAAKASSIKIGHIKSDGTLEILKSELSFSSGQWYITFDVTSFSPFAFITGYTAVTKTEATTVVKTGIAKKTPKTSVAVVATEIVDEVDLTVGDDNVPLAGEIENKAKATDSSKADEESSGGFPIPIPVAIAILALALLAFGGIGVKTGFIKLATIKK
jgi:hypothetical protein